MNVSQHPQEPQEQQDDKNSIRPALITGAMVILQLAATYSPHPQAVAQFAYVHHEDLPENPQRRERVEGKLEVVMGTVTTNSFGVPIVSSIGGFIILKKPPSS